MRTRRLLGAGLAAAAFLSAAPVAGAVLPPPPITEDTTWTKAGSPYRIVSTVVSPGATLTIEPGVEVIGEPGAYLFVEGTLRAEGTEAEPITFTGNPWWGGITFSGSETGQPPSVVRNVHMEDARVALDLGHDLVAVTDAVLTDNTVGIAARNPAGDLTLTGNELYSNGTAFVGRTTATIGLYGNDFWDNRISMMFEAQDPYSCMTSGVFEVHGNDVLRGPSAEWYSWDVRTSNESGETEMVVDASDNWWGSTDEWDIQGRMEPEGACCPYPNRTRVQWEEPAVAPRTPAEPPGPVGTPPEGNDFHGDIEYYADLLRPDWGDCLPNRSVQRIVGRVRESIGEVPEQIETVALVRGTRRCKSYDPSEGFVHRPCDEPIEFSLPVRKDGRFSLELRRPLRPGRYTLYAGYFGRDISKFRVLPD